MVNGQNSYIGKYSPSGQFLWSDNFCGTLVDFTFDNNGDIIVTGGFIDTDAFNDTNTSTSSPASQP